MFSIWFYIFVHSGYWNWIFLEVHFKINTVKFLLSTKLYSLKKKGSVLSITCNQDELFWLFSIFIGLMIVFMLSISFNYENHKSWLLVAVAIDLIVHHIRDILKQKNQNFSGRSEGNVWDSLSSPHRGLSVNNADSGPTSLLCVRRLSVGSEDNLSR